MSNYEVHVKSNTGSMLYILTQFNNLSAGRFDRAYQPLEILMPMDYPIGTFTKDMIFELWREQDGSMVLDGQTCYFLRDIKYLTKDNKNYIYLKAYDAIWLIDGREVEYAAGSAQATKSGVACDVMKAIMRENFVSATDTTRNLAASYFIIDADDGTGATVTKAFSRQYVYPLIQGLCNQSREAGTWVTFDVVYDGNLPLVFKTFTGQRGNDLRESLTLSVEAGNLANPELDFNYSEERTVAYMAGKGENEARVVGTSTNANALAESVWSRREVVSENFQMDVLASLNDAARALLNKYSSKVSLSGEISSTEGTEYGNDWNYGDYLRAQYLGYEFDCRVLGYLINYSNEGEKVKEEVKAFIRGEL